MEIEKIEHFISLPSLDMNRPIRALGIDLGTTNSTVSEVMWEPGKPPICNVLELKQPTMEGEYVSPLIPSMVVELPDKKIMIGEGAKRLRAFPYKANLIEEKNLFYETKNDMGLRKTYYKASEQFNHSSKIAGHILSFLKTGAEKASGGKYDRISVTVPASFQLNQRRDTLRACEYAGLKLNDDDLLDEPTAALIDYILTKGTEDVVHPGETTLCVVFDFGGGTCDVSVVEITGDLSSRKITMSELSVSRYHRLGGGDIDAAIVHEILIPSLLEENNLIPLDLTWAQKKRGLEPQLLGKAEALKLALCKEIDRLIKFGRYNETDKSVLIAKQPGMTCRLGKREFKLSNPSLSAEQFESLLEPFLDRDFLYARETEYCLTQSVFSPLSDALDRAGKKPHEIGFCLMVGGSSLIPQVKMAVENYFSKGTVRNFSNPLDMQTSVSKGAAWNSLFRHITGKPLIQPVLHEGIDLITNDNRRLMLIPPHTELPYPSDGSFKKIQLLVPPGKLFVDELRLEVVGQSSGQTIFNEIWKLPGSVQSGTEITMEYRLTTGKQLQCRAFLTEEPGEVFELVTENPLTNIVNPHITRMKIEETEEALRNKGGGSAEDRDTYVQLAQWYAELNQHEKALDFLRTALRKIQRPDPDVLNLQGIYYDELGDYRRAEKAYREADKAAATWAGPLFNLALILRKRGQHEEALKTINQAIEKATQKGPYLTLKVMCLESLNRAPEKQAALSEAERSFDPLEMLDDWELGWYITMAKLIGNEELIKRANKEKEKRSKKAQTSPGDDNILRPSVRGDLVKMEKP